MAKSIYVVSTASFSGKSAICLALALGLREVWASNPQAGWAETIWILGVVLSWIATTICIIRGVPVLIEARTRLRDLDAQMTEPVAK